VKQENKNRTIVPHSVVRNTRLTNQSRIQARWSWMSPTLHGRDAELDAIVAAFATA
jgi:hypothetical protein